MNSSEAIGLFFFAMAGCLFILGEFLGKSKLAHYSMVCSLICVISFSLRFVSTGELRRSAYKSEPVFKPQSGEK